MKTQKGITLIALIITIIVMLILVGVSVSVALNTGLFKSAQGAAKNTEAERLKETELSAGIIDGMTIEEYANSFGGGSSGARPELGDLVAYTPDANPTGSYSGVTYETYKKDTTVTTWMGNESNTGYYVEETKTYTPGIHEWIYMGEDKNGNSLLVSTTVSDFTVTLGGGAGWTNGADGLDSLCNTLYGSSSYGIARSFKREDYEMLTDYNGTGYGYKDLNGNYIETETSISIREVESILNKEFEGRQSPNNTSFIYQKAVFPVYSESDISKPKLSAVLSKCLDIGTANWWVSSPIVIARGTHKSVDFEMSSVSGLSFTSTTLFRSDGWEHAEAKSVRPVIVLSEYIQFGEKNSEGKWTLIEPEGDTKLDFNGKKVGDSVAYSAGGIDNWTIWKTDETAGTVTILGRMDYVKPEYDWTSDELHSLLNSCINPHYRDSIREVNFATIGELAGGSPLGRLEVGDWLATEEVELLTSYFDFSPDGEDGSVRFLAPYFTYVDSGEYTGAGLDWYVLTPGELGTHYQVTNQWWDNPIMDPYISITFVI